MKKSKKIIFSAVACALAAICVSLYFYISNDNVKTVPINQPTLREQTVTDVAETSAVVTVDGREVQAYMIDGRLEIAIEDMADYCGFTMESSEDELKLTTYYLEGYTQPVISHEDGKIVGQTSVDGKTIRINNILISNDCYNDKHYIDIDAAGELTDDYNNEFGFSDYNLKTIKNSDGGRTVECFRFPRINIPELLAERESVVGNAEIELYTEDKNGENTLTGAPYEPKKGVYAGINGDGNGDWIKLKKKLFKNDFGAYSNYIEFDVGQIEIFRPNWRNISYKNALWLVPWNTSDASLAMINDDYIREVLDMIKESGHPAIIRFACEMNVSELGDSPAAYVKAYRHTADIIHEYGFATMWSVNDYGALNKPYSLYYPGDEYVDWIGVSTYPKHDFMHTSPTSREDSLLFGCGDYAWASQSLEYLENFLEENNINKPLAVSEGAVESVLTYDGAPSAEELRTWGEKRLRDMYWYLPMRFSNLKMLTYFSVDSGGKAGGSNLENQPTYPGIISEALESGAYKLDYDTDAELVYTPLEEKQLTVSEDIPIYTYAYLPEEYVSSVKYTIDGADAGAYTEIPYKHTIPANTLSPGEHTLDITVTGEDGTVKNKSCKIVIDG